ncbi:MAG: hypothetical protein Tsb0014_41060 [Pleurocapsa sp.]
MFNVITPRGTEIQIYIAPPSSFILNHQSQLLPSWKSPIAYVILVLQQSRLSLELSNFDVVREKDYLREQFWRLGSNLIQQLGDRNYLGDLFDPRSGYPWLSPSGTMTLNDNAVVQALLDFPVTSYKNCSLLTHPKWNYAVYPSTIVTNASWEILKSILGQQIESQNWIVKK